MKTISPLPSRVAKKWKKLPKGWTDKSVEKFWGTLTGTTPEHKVWDCIEKMTKPFGDGAGAFCGGLADWQMPGWRQKNKKESPEARADAKSYWKGKMKGKKKSCADHRTSPRMASASGPVTKFLMRLRGKGKGALNINVLEEALPLLGWSITKTTAALRIADPDSVEPLLKAMLNPSFIWGYTGTKEPKRIDFDSVEKAEAGLRKWQREAQKGKPPPHPTFKKFYYTQALYPVEERPGGSRFRTGHFFDIVGLWLGVEAYEVKSPSGASVLLPVKPDYRGRFSVDLLRWKMAKFWTWAYKNGIQDDAAAYLDSMGAEEVSRVTAPASARSLDGTGTCPACFNNVKLRRGDRIMRHGWQVKGHRQWGSYGNTWHTGPCFGTGYLAFEVSPEGTKDYRDQAVIPYKKGVERELARVKRGTDPITVDKGRRWEKTHQPGDPEYARYQDISIKQGTKAISDLEQDIRTLDSRITGWKTATLPGARMASCVRVALRFAVRKAPPMQMGSAAMLKKQGLTPVDVFFGEIRPHNRPTLQLPDSVQDRKGDVYFFAGVAPDGSAILAKTENEGKRKLRKVIEDRKHYQSRLAGGSPLMLQPDYGTSDAEENEHPLQPDRDISDAALPRGKEAKALTTVWVVEDPTEDSEIIDMFWGTSDMQQFKRIMAGSLHRKRNMTLHDDKNSAYKDAVHRLNKLWKGQIPDWVMANERDAFRKMSRQMMRWDQAKSRFDQEFEDEAAVVRERAKKDLLRPTTALFKEWIQNGGYQLPPTETPEKIAKGFLKYLFKGGKIYNPWLFDNFFKLYKQNMNSWGVPVRTAHYILNGLRDERVG